jgi:hypothetical protein
MSEESTVQASDASESPSGAEKIGYALPTTPSTRQLNLSGPVTRGDVAILAVRFVGIYILLQGLPYLSPAMGYAFFPHGEYGIKATILLVAFFGGGVFILLLAPRIAGWLLPRREISGPDTAQTNALADLQPVAFSVVGLFLCIWAVPSLLFRLVANEELANRFAGTMALWTQLGLGAWLFLGGKSLSRFWQRLQSGNSRQGDESGPL